MKSAIPESGEAHDTSSDDSSELDSEEELGSTKPNNKPTVGQTAKDHLSNAEPLKKKRAVLDYNALSRHGYGGGLSVLKVPPPKIKDKDPDWSWSTGKEQDKKVAEESYEEREQTRAAATAGDKLLNAQKISIAHADRRDKNKSFSQKEKRKRDLGQASRGKSYVEEEKRLLRDSGVYSGFDS